MNQRELTTLPTPELLECVLRLAAEDPTGQSDKRWDVVLVLHTRAEPLVYQRAAEWCASDQPFERMLGADILAQLGATTKVVARRRRPFARQSTPILEGLLADADPLVVSSALFALGHLSRGDTSKIAALAAHSSADVRHAVAVALGGRDELPALQALILLAADNDEDVRNWATFGLGARCDADSPEIRAVLVSRLSDGNPEIRGEAMVGLARRGDQRAIGPVLDALSETEVPVLSGSERAGMLAVEAAEHLGSPGFVPSLERLHEAVPEDDGIRRALRRCREQR